MQIQKENARKTGPQGWESPAFSIVGKDTAFDSHATSNSKGHGASTQPASELRAASGTGLGSHEPSSGVTGNQYGTGASSQYPSSGVAGGQYPSSNVAGGQYPSSNVAGGQYPTGTSSTQQPLTGAHGAHGGASDVAYTAGQPTGVLNTNFIPGEPAVANPAYTQGGAVPNQQVYRQ